MQWAGGCRDAMVGKRGGCLESCLGGTQDGCDSSCRLYWSDLIDRLRRFKAPLLSAVIDPGIDPQISSKKSHLMVYEILYERANSLSVAGPTLTLPFLPLQPSDLRKHRRKVPTRPPTRDIMPRLQSRLLTSHRSLADSGGGRRWPGRQGHHQVRDVAAANAAHCPHDAHTASLFAQ